MPLVLLTVPVFCDAAVLLATGLPEFLMNKYKTKDIV